MQRLLITLLLPVTLVTLSNCGKEKNSSAPPSSEPAKTAAGAPVGNVETYTVDATGASFATSDSSMVVTIPAGAVSSSTTINVQQITNTCTAGIGKSFSLTPHGTVFQKPVSIRFSYAGQEEATIPKALGIAYHDKEGIWRMVNGAVVDTIHKTVTIQTTHFSNWTLLQWFKLQPVSAVIQPGETIELKVISFIDLAPDDILTPLLPDDGSEPTLSAGSVARSSLIKKWSVGGTGILQPNGATCTYKAPSSVNGVSTAAVVAELTSKYSQLLLVSNITIVVNGIILQIDGGDWITFNGSASYLDSTQFSISNGRADSAFTILWPGGSGSFNWNGEVDSGGVTLAQFSISKTGNVYQSQYEDDNMELQQSGGTLKIDRLGKIDEYVSGSFTANPCALVDKGGDQIGKVSLKGYFRVKRIY